MIHALIFVPGIDHHYWVTACWQYCMRRGYTPQAVVHNWADVARMMLADPRMVLVIARRSHLTQVEVVTEQPDPRRPIQSQQRTGRTSAERPPQPGPAY